jgi:hypothetical protein
LLLQLESVESKIKDPSVFSVKFTTPYSKGCPKETALDEDPAKPSKKIKDSVPVNFVAPFVFLLQFPNSPLYSRC